MEARVGIAGFAQIFDLKGQVNAMVPSIPHDVPWLGAPLYGRRRHCPLVIAGQRGVATLLLRLCNHPLLVQCHLAGRESICRVPTDARRRAILAARLWRYATRLCGFVVLAANRVLPEVFRQFGNVAEIDLAEIDLAVRPSGQAFCLLVREGSFAGSTVRLTNFVPIALFLFPVGCSALCRLALFWSTAALAVLARCFGLDRIAT